MSEEAEFTPGAVRRLGIAGVGLTHFTSPGLFERSPSRPFRATPVSTSTPTAASRPPWGSDWSAARPALLAIVGGIGYLAYLGGNAARSGR